MDLRIWGWVFGLGWWEGFFLIMLWWIFLWCIIILEWSWEVGIGNCWFWGEFWGWVLVCFGDWKECLFLMFWWNWKIEWWDFGFLGWDLWEG